MNKSLFILLSSLTMSAISSQKDELRPSVYAKPLMGIETLMHNKDGFTVVKEGKAYQVPMHLVDKNLRGRTNEQMAKYLAHHQVRINQAGENEFSIQEGTRALGAGAGGATVGFFAGKGLVYGASYGAIYGVGAVITFFGGPIAGGAFTETAKPLLAPFIDTASNTVGLAGGILLGALTGPA